MKKLFLINLALLILIVLNSCSSTSESNNLNTEKLIESKEVINKEKVNEQALSVRDKFTNTLSTITLPFNVNTESIENLSNTLLISNEVFDLLELQQIGDFDKNLEQTVLGKIDCENNLTGILVSQISNNESLIYYFLYNEELKVTGLTKVYYSNSEGSNNTESKITNGQVLKFTTIIDYQGHEIESKSVVLIDNENFINPGVMEAEEFEAEDPIEFAISTPEELTAGSGILPLKSSTVFQKRLNSSE